MSHHRFFVDEALKWQPAQTVTVPLSDADRHHALNVLRLEDGEIIEVASTVNDAAYEVALVRGAHGEVVGRVARELSDTEVGSRVTLVQGVAKGEKMDLVVRQAVEVGVAAITPLLTERSIVRLEPGKREAKAERWRRIARSAAEQAHRGVVPRVAAPVEFAGFLANAREFDHIVVLWEEAVDGRSPTLDEIVAGWVDVSGEVALIVGPEGGLSDTEVAALIDAGAQVATLGPSVLRTETAALVGAATLIHELRKATRASS